MMTGQHDPSGEARATLEQLRADRQSLDRTTRTPSWLAPAMGLVAAVYVASPALVHDRPGRTSAYVAAVLAVLVLFELTRRRTGRREAAPGRRAWPLLALVLLVLLVSFSVSLGLVSLGRAAWVVLPATASAAATFLAVRALDRHARGRMRV